MKRAASLEGFVAEPVGSWIAIGTSVAWVASPSLGGVTAWGRPDGEAARVMLRQFEALWASTMNDGVDLVLDARRIEHVDPAALAATMTWSRERREAIGRRVRRQVGVVPPGLVGLTLAGILPILGDARPFRVVEDPFEAHRAFGDDGSLCREIEAHVAEVLGVPADLRALRDMLRVRHTDITLTECARALGSSTRSLQRALGLHGTSFQKELGDARFAAARELLEATDEKVAAIAHHVGVSEGALTQIVRERAGCTPSDLRRSRR